MLSKIREGEELKASRHASAAVICDDYVTTYNIVPTGSNIMDCDFNLKLYILKFFNT